MKTRSSLAQDDKTTWDKLSDDGKAKLLGYKQVKFDEMTKLETNKYEVLNHERHGGDTAPDPHHDKADSGEQEMTDYIDTLMEQTRSMSPHKK